jgi:hypothetical protein
MYTYASNVRKVEHPMQQSWENPWRRPRHAPVFVHHRVPLKRWLHLRNIKRLRPGVMRWDVFRRYADERKAEQQEISRGLHMLLRAKDGLAACGMIVLNPILMMESSCELLKRAIARADARGDEEGKQLLERHLALLALAREKGVIGVMRKLTQKG